MDVIRTVAFVVESETAAIAVRAPSGELLIIRVCRGYDDLFGYYVQNRLLHVACAIGKKGPLNRQSHGILCFTHVGVYGQGNDRQFGRVTRDNHLIAGLGIVLEDLIPDVSNWVQ